LNLTDLKIKDSYRSGEDNLLDDFYLPVLKTAHNYDRAVGFFSSSLLVYALQGISSIIKSKGKMRLIIGHPLTDEEYKAVKDGFDLRHIAQSLEGELDRLLDTTSSIDAYRLIIFTAMIATGRLEVKFAFRPHGMYHEKIGIIKDRLGHKLLFHGSANETTKAIDSFSNYESFNVFKGWQTDIYQRFAQKYEDGFEDIWSGADGTLLTLDLPSAMYNKIHQHHLKNSLTPIDFEAESRIMTAALLIKENHYPVIPKKIGNRDFSLFPHQENALRSWYDNDQRGILKLATGAGKTITALYGVSKLFEVASRPRKLIFIVAVPYVALAEQWVNELKMFNMNPVACFGNRKSWSTRLGDKINNLLTGNVEFFSLVVVNKTLSTNFFQNTLSKIDSEYIFFVGDECHRHGAEGIAIKLPDARFRLGLSATPYRESHEIGSDLSGEDEYPAKDRIIKYYGDVVAYYGLDDALLDEVLTPYNYYLNVIYLTIEETEAYLELSKQIGRFLSIDKGPANTALNNAIRKRNKIVANAQGKLPALKKLLTQTEFKEKSYTLFYVGEGKPGLDDDDDLREYSEDEDSQLDKVAGVIKGEGWKVSSFTAKESTKDRQKIMSSFTDGSIDGLVSMRVLDEGIDIPKCQRAFILASSRNSRQFIQRRGRILRKYPGKELAHIYDFLVVPSPLNVQEAGTLLVKNELKRAMDFVLLASNSSDVRYEARKIAEEFGIDLMEIARD